MILDRNALKCEIRFHGTANILVFQGPSGRFETACFNYPQYTHNIISLSVTAEGCIVGCKFCDVPNAGKGRNLRADEIVSQVLLANEVMSDCSWVDLKKPFKVAFNRAGDPLLNPHVASALEKFGEGKASLELNSLINCLEIVSVMPRTKISEHLLDRFVDFAKRYNNDFYIQVSMHTSDERVRKAVIPYRHLMSFEEISLFGKKFYEETGGKRQMTLAFHLMENLPVDPRVIREIFSPDHFRIRVAYYSPTTNERKRAFPRSRAERIFALVGQFKGEGYNAFASIISPGEHMMNTHPGSGLGLFINLEKNI